MRIGPDSPPVADKFGDILTTKQDFFAKIYDKETPVEHMVTHQDFQVSTCLKSPYARTERPCLEVHHGPHPGGRVNVKDQTRSLSLIVSDDFPFSCTQVKGDIPTTLDGSLALVVREPYGVVLSLTPFNMGLTLTLRAILYAIACGNTVLLKTSERLPELCTEIAKTFKEAGLPGRSHPQGMLS